MIRLFFGFFIFSLSAHAVLGGRSSDIRKDFRSFHGQTVSSHEPASGCYSVTEMNSNGINIKEFINKQTGTVFGIRTASRTFVPLRHFLNPSHFDEFQKSRNNSNFAVRTFNRHHKKLIAESDHLKIFVEDRQTVHRNLLFLKPKAPSCVTNPESLQ